MRRLSRALAGALICVGGFQPALASPLCTTATLSSYLGKSCSIGNVLFSFSSYAYSYTPDDKNVPASAVTVTPLGTGQELVPTGFRFSASDWYATNPDKSGRTMADINLTLSAVFNPTFNSKYYDFNTTTLLLVASIANATGNTGISADETIADKNYKPLSSINLVAVGNTDAVSQGLGGTALSGTSNFKSKGVILNKDLLMIAGDNPNSVQINSFTQSVTYIDGPAPEPCSMVLAVAGLALLAFLNRRRLRSLGLLCGMLMALSEGAYASTCAATDISKLLTPGYSCNIGDAMFSDFSYSYTGNGSAGWASDPNVIPIDDGSNIGFQFRPLWAIAGSETLSITFSFRVYTLQWQVTTFTASESGRINGAGSGATLTQGAIELASESFVSPSRGGSTSLSPWLSSSIGNPLTITNTVIMTSSGLGAQVSDLTNTLQEHTPEPGTSLLAGGALLGLAAMLRNNARR